MPKCCVKGCDIKYDCKSSKNKRACSSTKISLNYYFVSLRNIHGLKYENQLEDKSVKNLKAQIIDINLNKKTACLVV